mgnify:CR=1 FL=1
MPAGAHAGPPYGSGGLLRTDLTLPGPAALLSLSIVERERELGEQG